MKIRITRKNNYLENYEKADTIVFQGSHEQYIIVPGKKWRIDCISDKHPYQNTSKSIAKSNAITQMNILLSAGYDGFFVYTKKPFGFIQD